MSGRLGDHNLPGVHAFREVLGKNLQLFIYHGGLGLEWKSLTKKACLRGGSRILLGRGCQHYIHLWKALGNETRFGAQRPRLESPLAFGNVKFLTLGFWTETWLMVSVQKPNFKWCKGPPTPSVSVSSIQCWSMVMWWRLKISSRPIPKHHNVFQWKRQR